jgi:hypothetical protein
VRIRLVRGEDFRYVTATYGPTELFRDRDPESTGRNPGGVTMATITERANSETRREEAQVRCSATVISSALRVNVVIVTCHQHLIEPVVGELKG